MKNQNVILKKRNAMLQAAIAATFGLVALNASAATTVGNPAMGTYATQGIPSTGAVTIQAGIIYTANNILADGADHGLVTFTLPAGVTFVSTPTVTADATAFTAATVGGGGAGSNTLVINVTRASVTSAGTVTLGSFQVTGATALATATAAGAFEITGQASGWTVSANNDLTAAKADLAQSASQLQVSAGVTNLQIDVTSPSNGTQYVDTTGAGGNSIAGSGYLGTVNAGHNTWLNSTATGAYAFTTTTPTVALGLDLTGVSSAYIVTPAAVCAATKPAGAISGALSGSTATFAGLVAGTTYGVCVQPNGTSLLNQTGTPGVSVTASEDTTSTTTNNAGTTQDLGTITYNGTAVTAGYVVAAASGYNNYIRVINPAATASRIIVLVKRDDGTTASGVLNAAQAANTAALYTPAQINTAVGSNIISTAADRAQVTVLSPANITAENLMFNPTGTVVKMP